MVTGELVHHEENELAEDVEHGYGAVVTGSGRISTARAREEVAVTLPFSTVQLNRLDEAMTLSTRATGLGFSIYLGALGADSRDKAEELHAGLGAASSHSVLIAASPGERKVEVVTGEEAARRITDRGCNLAVMSMVASFDNGDLVTGLLSGLRMLSDQAGNPPRH